MHNPSLSLKTEYRSVEIIIQLPYIQSINRAYRPGVSKHGTPYIYLSPELKDFKSEIKSQLERTTLDRIAWIKRVAYFKIHQGVIFNRNFDDRDVTNTIKATEDAIFEYLELNDSKNINYNTAKFLNETNDYEYIIYRISKSVRSTQFTKESYEDWIK